MKFGSGFFTSSYDFNKMNFSEAKPLGRYLGLPQWGCLEWRGTLYPKKSLSADLLSLYSQRLNCVEVSSTFYSNIEHTTIKKWYESVSDVFRFLPKWPQEITHFRRLKVDSLVINQFIESMLIFKEKLGTTILQLPPDFSTSFKHDLFNFLELVPSTFPLSIEFRHSSWFDDEKISIKLFEYLNKRNFSMVCTDAPSRRDVFHYSFPSRNSVIRFASDHKGINDQARLDQWKKYLDNNKYGGNIFFLIHKTDNEFTPDLIKYICPKIANHILSINEDDQLTFI